MENLPKKLYTIHNHRTGLVYKQVLATERHEVKQRWAAYWLGDNCPVFDLIDADHIWQIFSKNGFSIIEFELELKK